jgi:hypothetical protein
VEATCRSNAGLSSICRAGFLPVTGGIAPLRAGGNLSAGDEAMDLQINKVSDRGPLDVEFC